MGESKMPARIRVAQDADGFWTCREAVSGSPEFIRADLVEPLVEALRFYTGIHEPGLSNPNEGPWGVNSTDFGERARAALAACRKETSND